MSTMKTKQSVLQAIGQVIETGTVPWDRRLHKRTSLFDIDSFSYWSIFFSCFRMENMYLACLFPN